MTAPVRAPRQLFAAEVRRPEPEIDLARAALLVAKEQYPQLAVEQYRARLDQLAEEVKDRLDDETAPLVVLQELLRVLHERHGFRGNAEAYYDPRNSFLNDVLDRRLGIPLTLGIVVLEVGWRLGLPLEGVNFPHHFLVRFAGDALDVLVDPFDGGRIRFAGETQELLDRVYGGRVRLQDSFLRRADRRDILVRLLDNLKGVYLGERDDERALAVVERLILLAPEADEERRVRGTLLARLGRHADALDELEGYLARVPGSPHAGQVRALMRRLRSWPEERPAEDAGEGWDTLGEGPERGGDG